MVSVPELETWIETWANRNNSSRSYTHIIRNVYSDPSKVFDEMLNIKEITDCSDANSTENYDKLIEQNQARERGLQSYDEYEHKKALYKCIMSVNILEGVRFYVSFACSWAFAELKKMEGNAKIIKFIARDENVHLASTPTNAKNLTQDDKDYEKIAQRTKRGMYSNVLDAVEQEKQWADYLFKDGSIIGLNAELLQTIH